MPNPGYEFTKEGVGEVPEMEGALYQPPKEEVGHDNTAEYLSIEDASAAEQEGGVPADAGIVQRLFPATTTSIMARISEQACWRQLDQSTEARHWS